MMSMPSSSKNDIILVRYPFSDLSDSKVRPAVVVSAPHVSQDIFIVPLTSKTASLLGGEFLLADWKAVGLNVPTAVKRGYSVQEIKRTIFQEKKKVKQRGAPSSEPAARFPIR